MVFVNQWSSWDKGEKCALSHWMKISFILHVANTNTFCGLQISKRLLAMVLIQLAMVLIQLANHLTKQIQ